MKARYTVTAWIVDRRCNDNCNLKSFETDTLEDAMALISKIKKAWGDSVRIYDKAKDETRYIELRDDQKS